MRNRELVRAVGRLLPVIIVLAFLAAPFGYFALGIRDESLGPVMAIPLLVVFALSEIFVLVLPNYKLTAVPKEGVGGRIVATLACMFTWSSLILGVSAKIYSLMGLPSISAGAIRATICSLKVDAALFAVYVVVALFFSRRSFAQSISGLCVQVVNRTWQVLRTVFPVQSRKAAFPAETRGRAVQPLSSGASGRVV